MLPEYAQRLSDVRARHPLVHNITNFVVMNITANALLAIEASPVMAHAVEEMEEMVGLANALVVNIGTLSEPWITAMKQAVTTARDRNIPYILDPVGAGATRLRTRTAQELLEIASPTVIRGNASEIAAIANESAKTRGVDSTLAATDVLAAAKGLAQQHSTTVVVSGAVDHVLSPDEHGEVHNGTPMMSRITGMGCTATALIGAFAAVSPAFPAAVTAMATMGIAGEIAVQKSQGPGTFVPHFLDALANLTTEKLATYGRITLG
jgi:hydroxyethylthiazole kinase